MSPVKGDIVYNVRNHKIKFHHSLGILEQSCACEGMALFARFFQGKKLDCGADERKRFLGVKIFFEAFRSFGGESVCQSNKK